MTSLIAYVLPDVRGINYIIIALDNGITENNQSINHQMISISFLQKRKIGGPFDTVIFLKQICEN